MQDITDCAVSYSAHATTNDRSKTIDKLMSKHSRHTVYLYKKTLQFIYSVKVTSWL